MRSTLPPKKVFLGSQSAEIDLPSTLDTFRSILGGVFPPQRVSMCKLHYFDREGDEITVESQEEYEFALEDAKLNPTFAFYLVQRSEGASSYVGPLDQFKELSQPVLPEGAVPPPADFEPMRPTQVLSVPTEEEGDDLECLFCNGTRLNKKGGQCNKCNGTGKLIPAWKQKLEKMVERQISRMFGREIERQASQLLQSIRMEDLPKLSQVISKGINLVGEGVKRQHPEPKPEEVLQAKEEVKEKILQDKSLCVACNKDITNQPYNRCPVCLRYNVCDECAVDLMHEHQLERIALPSQEIMQAEPLKEESANPREIPPKKKTIVDLVEETKSVLLSQGKDPAKSILINPSLQNIKIRYEDETPVENDLRPGEVFSKAWTFVNSGKEVWPEGMKFVPIGENVFKAEPIGIPAVFPGKKCEITAILTAPINTGNYRQTFEVQLNGDRVGNRVWAEARVVPKPVSMEIEEGERDKKLYAQETLQKLKQVQSVPKEYEANLLILLERSDEDPEWILSLLKTNRNNLNKVIDVIFS